ncbi:hypothetical protein BDK51DRAFT_45467 [Blyttiomyces helicus]|uniref:Uncharacterized protein n=1 Tax=Blyttiomyces helicus TaxID=388810 RepID=A0A4P9WFV3_9FUNG|nr:hypothetical protein BDK51DRAFT_45467 [Blyttiomyces helicus]|eukprot:RKO91659.1 hypothetical protein BDK51DRAFT_45467 [Blyttiomyces helicus]
MVGGTDREKDLPMSSQMKAIATLLMHVSKAKISVADHLQIMGQTIRMAIAPDGVDLVQDGVSLKTTIAHAVAHPQGRKLNYVAGLNQMCRVALTTSMQITNVETVTLAMAAPIHVILVDHADVELRGFAGIDCIYVNVRAWKFLQEGIKADNEYETNNHYRENFRLAFCIEAALLALHEYCHVLCCRAAEDLNFSTPSCVLQAPPLAGRREAGRIAEANFWGLEAKTFLNSLLMGGLDTQWLRKWVERFEKSDDLPPYEASVGADKAFDCIECGWLKGRKRPVIM